ncbi:MAG: M24 family metallopeptidase [Acidimicrobiia bacterium]|nr:M24 family metallopeptidase [Acidimicrobiia bacterium]NNC92910.1 M24 family metallopeptidase [Acidimicrobiia bacterium]
MGKSRRTGVRLPPPPPTGTRPLAGPAASYHRVVDVLPLRDRADLLDVRLQHRLDTIVPALMEREGIDAWVLIAREYNEDPVVGSMLPATWLSARRRTILLFLRSGPAMQRLTVSRYDIPGLFEAAWDPAVEPDQYARLAELLTAAGPAAVAISVGDTYAVGDGLSHTEHGLLSAALPDELRTRLVSGERLAVGWFETRLPVEVEQLAANCAAAHGFLRRALSREVVTPGETTTDDVAWWLRQTVADAGLESWFHPTVDVQRPGSVAPDSFSTKLDGGVIHAGDLVHIDFGISYLGLMTDQQQHAYVLREGEVGPPAGLVSALATGNRLQDLLMAEFATGRTGNEILAATRKAASAANIDGLIYSHPIGNHGHGAGPAIGLWDQQDGVPGAGDYPVHPATAYSIELMARVEVPEFGGAVSIMLEEDAIFDGEAVRFLDGRQTEFHLI